MQSVLKRATSADLKSEPYPYVLLDNALDPDLYNALEREYPFESRIDGFSGYANNERYQISAIDALRESRMSPLWREFIEYHTSAAFYEEVVHFFAPALEQYVPQLRSHPSVGVRFRNTTEIVLDCQPGINSPVSKETSVKGAHLDNPLELFAGLLYFRHAEDDSKGGDLELYRFRTHSPAFRPDRSIDDSQVEKFATVPYAANRLVFFLNTVDSVHGVSPRSRTPYTRRLTNFVGESRGTPFFSIPMRKSGLSLAKSLLRSLAP